MIRKNQKQIYDNISTKTLTLEELREDQKLKYKKIYDEIADDRGKNKHYGSGFHASNLLNSIPQMNSVCDVGTGNGEFVEWMYVNRCNDVIGTDIARQRPTNLHENIQWYVCSAHEIPLEDRRVDYVTAFGSIEHFLLEDIDKSLDEMRRIAKIGFIFSIPFSDSSAEINGRRFKLHMIVKPEVWWTEKLIKYGNVKKDPLNKYQGRRSGVGKYFFVDFI